MSRFSRFVTLLTPLRHRGLAALATLALGGVLAGSSGAASGAPTTPTAWCGGSESWQSARRSDGDVPVRIKARVASVTYARSVRGAPTFIDLGKAYPSRSRLTLVIWGVDRPNFPLAPERMFRPGQTVCAQGFVTWYRGVAQIEVSVWDPTDRLLSF